MKQPLDRFKALTLAAVDALERNEIGEFQALIHARGEELARVDVASLAASTELVQLDAKLQIQAGLKLSGYRGRMQQLAHVKRTARAVVAAQRSYGHLDMAG